MISWPRLAWQLSGAWAIACLSGCASMQGGETPAAPAPNERVAAAAAAAPAGAEWLQRLTNAFPKFAWINPEPQGVWGYRQSISVIQQLMNQRMFPLTLPGLEGAMRLLVK